MKYGINVVAVVVNDGALSAIKGSQQKGCEGRTIDTDLLNPDFVEFAKSFGAYAKRVEDLGNFKETLRDALACRKTSTHRSDATRTAGRLLSTSSDG